MALVGDEIWPSSKFLPRIQRVGAVNYGQPFSIQSLEIEPTGDKHVDDQNLMNTIMFKVAELLPEEKRGYYSLTSSENS